MTRAGTIPLSDIERIQIYFNTGKLKSTKANLKKILKQEGGEFITNAAIFLRSGAPCCHLKVCGEVSHNPGYRAWCISWDTPANFAVRAIPKTGASYANYMECVHVIIAGKKIDPINCGADMKYATHRVAYGVKEGRFAYYATTDNITPETLRDRLFDAGWSDAIMMDGGGSACFIDKNGDGFVGDGRVIPFFIIVHKKKAVTPDNEPKGEKPMVEVNVYSRAKEGEKYVAKNFQVKEFACSDGSDPVFIAQTLPMVCQYIRVRVGKSIKINSAYRTTEKNKAVGGAEYSQHLYGTAADLQTPAGWTPAQLALIAREIMPDWGGVGIYPWGIHVDVRDTKADWNG
jgi:hypothetical protein